jgi:hypothetical protein
MTTIAAVVPEADDTPPLTRAQRRLPQGILHTGLSQLEQALHALEELARSVDDPRVSMLTDVADQRLDNLRRAAAELGASEAMPADIQTTDLGRCLVRSMQRVRAALNAEVGRVQIGDVPLLVAARPGLLELACEELLLAAAGRGDIGAVEVRVAAKEDGALLSVSTSAQLGTDTLMRVLPQLSHALDGDSEGGLEMTAATVTIRCGQARGVVDGSGTRITAVTPVTTSIRPLSPPSAAQAARSAAEPERVGHQ